MYVLYFVLCNDIVYIVVYTCISYSIKKLISTCNVVSKCFFSFPTLICMILEHSNARDYSVSYLLYLSCILYCSFIQLVLIKVRLFNKLLSHSTVSKLIRLLGTNYAIWKLNHIYGN